MYSQQVNHHQTNFGERRRVSERLSSRTFLSSARFFDAAKRPEDIDLQKDYDPFVLGTNDLRRAADVLELSFTPSCNRA